MNILDLSNLRISVDNKIKLYTRKGYVSDATENSVEEGKQKKILSKEKENSFIRTYWLPPLVLVSAHSTETASNRFSSVAFYRNYPPACLSQQRKLETDPQAILELSVFPLRNKEI